MTKTILTAIITILITIGSHSFCQTTTESVSIGRIMPRDEVRTNLRALDQLRAELRASAGSVDQKDGDFIAVTISGASPKAVPTTMTATLSANGLWKIERIEGMVSPIEHPNGRTTVSTYFLDATTSRRVSNILAQDRLFDEVEGSADLCNDHPIASIRIVANGKVRAAVRIACPGHDSSDVTQQLIDAVQTAAR